MYAMNEEKYINTDELARRLCIKPESIRRGLCVKGHYLSLKPKKLPNGRLLWSMREVGEIIEAAQ